MQEDFRVIRQYNFPTTIRFGAGASAELADCLRSSGLQRPILVTDPQVESLEFFRKIRQSLVNSSLAPETFSRIHKNPVKSDVLLAGESYHQTNRDCIVGIGGGAAMDVARALALHAHHARDLFDYDDLIGGEQYVTETIPPFFTMPTTSGTGSEVGRSAIISEDESHRKRILFSPKLMARVVFADPLLTMDLPPFITAATGMDALTHHMEAFVAKGFHPLCEGIALEGMRLIYQSIEEAVRRPDLPSRGRMMIASLMGAVAFQKGLGVVHSLAHPLSSLLDTHHGLANAVNLPAGLRFNGPGLEPAFRRMARAMDLASDSVQAVVAAVVGLNASIGLPSNLRALGVSQEHLDVLPDLALADFCHPSNPRPVSREDFSRLYRESW
jgi:alcohol dehydrogenase class IV